MRDIDSLKQQQEIQKDPLSHLDSLKARVINATQTFMSTLEANPHIIDPEDLVKVTKVITSLESSYKGQLDEDAYSQFLLEYDLPQEQVKDINTFPAPSIPLDIVQKQIIEGDFKNITQELVDD